MRRDLIIVWFRQDLRLADNLALAAAVEQDAEILPVYVLDEETPGRWAPGGASRWWLHHSLASLAQHLETAGSRLVLRRGPARSVLTELAIQTGARAIHCTRAYEPWARRLEDDLGTDLAERGVVLRIYPGTLLREPEDMRNRSGKPFKVFTPFWRALCDRAGPRRPRSAPASIRAARCDLDSDSLDSLGLLPTRPDWAGGLRQTWQPGEAHAAARLDQFIEALAAYAEARNRPDLTGTSWLSPHLHFGETSPALCWHAACAAARRGGAGAGLETFLKELAWREFSYHLLYHWPDLPEEPLRPEFGAFPWRRDPSHLAAWQRGRTGYPIVDAGMRELWATGWMHNRVLAAAGVALGKTYPRPIVDHAAARARALASFESLKVQVSDAAKGAAT